MSIGRAFIALVLCAPFFFTDVSVRAAPGDWSSFDSSAVAANVGGAFWPVYSLSRTYVLGGLETTNGARNYDFGYWDFSDAAAPTWVLINSGNTSYAGIPAGGIAGSAAYPGSRYRPAAIVDSASNASDIRLWLFAGDTIEGILDDLWYFSTASGVRCLCIYSDESMSQFTLIW